MSQTTIERVMNSSRLPSLPAIALEVIELVQDPNVDLRTIAATIQHDPALAGKVLKTVNSSFYGQPKAITTITNALIVLGLNSVKTLALGFTLVNNMKDSEQGGFDHAGFWRHCVLSSTGAKVLMEASRQADPEEAFLGALLQDLGQLALVSVMGDDYSQAIAGVPRHQLCAREGEVFDADHTEIGGALSAKWRLPQMLQDVIAHHERPDSYKGEHLPLVRAVALANQFAELIVEDEVPASRVSILARRADEWLGIDTKSVPDLIQDIHSKSRDVQKLLEVPAADLGDPDMIMDRASEALQDVTLQTAMQAQQLEVQNEKLNYKASTDALTGAHNRDSFNTFIAEQFEAASADEPLSVLFMDTDHFKKFNDTHGHLVGDRVLVEQAALLKRFCPENGMAARYGGEEFAFVLPNHDRRSAAVLAEAIRRAVEMLDTVQSDEGETLYITNSIGVATYDGTVFATPEQLIKAADQAVYAAKHAGRNNVRVFKPRLVSAAA